MLKPLSGLAAAGVAALVLYKLMVLLLLPLVGVAIGLAMLVVKALFILLTVILAIWVFRRMTRRESVTA
jgi:hypothetical protein